VGMVLEAGGEAAGIFLGEVLDDEGGSGEVWVQGLEELGKGGVTAGGAAEEDEAGLCFGLILRGIGQEDGGEVSSAAHGGRQWARAVRL
jgi:hypothetical protein